MAINALSYNKATSREFGWQPSWFGVDGFQYDLIRAIKEWQQARGLHADGLIGPSSYRLLLEERQARGTATGVSKQVFYNRASAAKLGWNPTWFGASRNDESLVAAVREWQMARGVVGDGMVGPATFRRAATERDSRSPVSSGVAVTSRGGRSIVYNGEPFPIEWDRVVLWTEAGGLKCEPGTFRSYAGRPRRPVKMFVNHWDATLSARHCANALEKRGISVHFCLDNDGTIYQLVDMQHVAWQAKGVNTSSVGVEISNAFYPRYQEWYEHHGFGHRPVLNGIRLHGNPMESFLGFYDVQIEALKALWKAVHGATGIPLEAPSADDGSQVEGVDPRVVARTFQGFVNHYHVTNRKIDCAGLDLARLIGDLRAEMARAEPRATS